ncbi:unnamed protein product [Parajaminaea phylloscopi]
MLVSLEITDFKSYRGTQVIGPFKSFSAVIGPNGSGKSNLMDAISFVLGVKSAQLRSSNLRDVIFRGRRMAAGPGNASGESDDSDDAGEGASSADAHKASVTAVYRDRTGKEWRFQRTITLAGVSEYRVNGRVHSYASYNRQLEQFRILVKAKNFLVFQGDVEAVAQQGSRDLARLIDQISGSLELKDDYEEAKVRMERSHEESASAFNKRRGINGELKTFREQKAEVERWESLQEERDAHILQLVLWQLYQSERQVTESRATIEDTSAKIPSLRRDCSAEERNVESRRKEAANALRDVSRAEREVRKLEKEIEDLQPSLDALDERGQHSERRTAAAEKIISEIQRDLERSRADLRKLEDSYELTKQAAQRAEDEESARSSELNLSPDDVDEYHVLRAEAAVSRATERQQLDTLQRQLRARRATVEAMAEKVRQLTRTRDKLEAESLVAGEQKSSRQSQIDDLNERLQSSRQQLASIQEERSQIRRRETQLNDLLQECYSKLIQAGNDAKQSEREVKMKETVTALSRIFPGVRGRLVDLCKPTQQKYDQAVSTVLGRNVEAVIVDHEKTAIDCIEYFRNQRVGQATFIPLDTIQAKPINDRLRSVARGARLAIDVIQYDGAIEAAMQYVCGNALVCDTLDVARHISYEKKIEAKTVTLDGTVIHKSGLITGGQSGDRAGRWEDREVQGLQRQQQECLDELRTLAARRRELPPDDTLVAQISECESRLLALRDDLLAATSRHNDLVTELDNTKRQIDDMDPKVGSAQAELKTLENEVAALQQTVDLADDVVFAQFCQRVGISNIREYEQKQLALLERQKDARLEFEVQMKRLQHQITFLTSQIRTQEERLQLNERVRQKEQDRLAAVADERQQVRDTLEEITAEIVRREARLQSLKETQEEKAAELTAAKRDLSRCSKALDAALKEIAALNDQIEKLSGQRSEVLRRCRLEEIDLPLRKGSLNKVPLEDAAGDGMAPMDIDEDSTQRAIKVPDFGIEVDYDDLDEDARVDGSHNMEVELRARVDRLNTMIEKMAPNTKAADRLGDTEARFRATEADFEKARKESAAAKTAFNDIKKRRCDLFNKAFNHISGRIDSVYKDLTKGKAAPMGGVAYLSLEDTEEPYLSGVRYHAMPPMKRFRDMDQLSGGEKTMAALALLFCVATFAPPPFFVLDEVDAALDSQNVAKVATYIRSQARPEFQFIVISLKASLYERAEGLVGVYRKTDDGQNSSASLTLDLEKYQ